MVRRVDKGCLVILRGHWHWVHVCHHHHHYLLVFASLMNTVLARSLDKQLESCSKQEI